MMIADHIPRVSVVIAAYNHAAFVRECIDSVRDQTFSDWEICVTDDGSSDGTADILRELASTDPRIRLNLFAENQGACVAINDAIARANCELVALLNSDDRWLPEKLSRQIAFLDQHPDHAAVFTLPRLIDERGAVFADENHKDYRVFDVANRSRSAWLDHFFRYGNCLCHPSLLIRRSCYTALGTYDPRLAQLPDFDMWVRLCARHEIHILTERLVEFRILDGERNASAARPEVLAREPWERLHILRHYLRRDLAEQVTPMTPPGHPESPDATPPHIRLAWTALAIGTPAHRAFALEILHHALESGLPPVAGLPDFRDYLRLTGATDVFWQQGMSICHRLQSELEQNRQVATVEQTHAQTLLAQQALLHQQRDALQSALETAQAQLQELQTSRSWRLTAPLRWLARSVWRRLESTYKSS